MKFLSINTAQNVRIEYELAPNVSRLIAGIIDFIICNIGVVLSYAIFWRGNSFNILGALLSIAFYLYPFFAEAFFNGKTIGKSMLNLQVIKIDGTPLTVSDCLLRWFFRILEIYLSMGAIGIIAYLTSANNQRIGDILAKTVVITNSPKRNIYLANVLKIANSSNHIVTYHDITKLPEKDLVSIKNILDTKSEYSTETYNIIINKAIQKIGSELDIDIKKIIDKENFLRTLITDYVVLTR